MTSYVPGAACYLVPWYILTLLELQSRFGTNYVEIDWFVPKTGVQSHKG